MRGCPDLARGTAKTGPFSPDKSRWRCCCGKIQSARAFQTEGKGRPRGAQGRSFACQTHALDLPEHARALYVHGGHTRLAGIVYGGDRNTYHEQSERT